MRQICRECASFRRQAQGRTDICRARAREFVINFQTISVINFHDFSPLPGITARTFAEAVTQPLVAASPTVRAFTSTKITSSTFVATDARTSFTDRSRTLTEGITKCTTTATAVFCRDDHECQVLAPSALSPTPKKLSRNGNTIRC